MSFDDKLSAITAFARGKNPANIYLTYDGNCFSYDQLGWCDWIVTWVLDTFTNYKIANICHVFQRAVLEYYSEKAKTLTPERAALLQTKNGNLKTLQDLVTANRPTFNRYADASLKAAHETLNVHPEPAHIAPGQGTALLGLRPDEPREGKDDNKVRQLERQLEALRSQSDRLTQAKDQAEAQNALLVAQNAEQQERIQRMAGQLDDLRHAASRAPTPQLPLPRMDHKANGSGNGDDREIARLVSQVQHLTTANERLKEQHAGFKQLREQLAQAESQNAVLRAQQAELTAQLQQQKGAMQNNPTGPNGAPMSIVVQRSMETIIQQKVEEQSGARIRQLEAELAKIRRDQERADAARVPIVLGGQQELAGIPKQIEDLKRENAQLKAAIRNQQRLLDVRPAQPGVHSVAHKPKAAVAEEDRQRVDAAARRIPELEHELESRQQTILQLQQELTALQRKVVESAPKPVDLREVSRQQQEERPLKEENGRLKAEVASLREALQISQQQAAAQPRPVAVDLQLANAERVLRERITTLEKEKSDLEGRLVWQRNLFKDYNNRMLAKVARAEAQAAQAKEENAWKSAPQGDMTVAETPQEDDSQEGPTD